MIYLDNAATTFPKPHDILDRMINIYQMYGVSPNRGGYDLAVEAGAIVEEARQKLSCFFGAPDPNRVIFTSNATDALNIAIKGIVRRGDHVVCTRLEHNSVLRPLFHLKKELGIDFDMVPFNSCGVVEPDRIYQTINGRTKLVILCHASNVLGTVQPVIDVAKVCSSFGIPLLLDVAQSAGLIPIDMETWGVSAIAFTGHKALMGPSGIGGLVLLPGIEIVATRYGGTGIDSANLYQNLEYPHRLEVGTLNILGVIGLSAGLDYIEKSGMGRTLEREVKLSSKLYQGLLALDKVKVYSGNPQLCHTPVITFNIEGKRAEDVGVILDADFGISARAGLHCAPFVHKDIGTSPLGAVRFSLGPFNTDEEIDTVLKAVSSICSSK